MNILMPENNNLGDDDIIHTWYSPITNKNTMHFSDNLPLDIPKNLLDKEIYVILDKFENVNYEFIKKIYNKKVCLDVGAEEFIEYYTNQYLINFFRQANIMQLNNNVSDFLFKKLKLNDEFDFFNILNLDLLIITNGKKGATFLYKENNGIKQIKHVPSIISNAVDTSGAGDAFFSVIIREYAYCDKIDELFINKTFELANSFSRDIISKLGSRKI